MLLVTTEQIAGRNVELLGIVEGSSIQTVHAGKDIMNSLKTLVGGNGRKDLKTTILDFDKEEFLPILLFILLC